MSQKQEFAVGPGRSHGKPFFTAMQEGRLDSLLTLLLLLWPTVGDAQSVVRRAQGEVVYLMQPGDSPWTISQNYLLGMNFWPRVVRLNGFIDSTRLAPGTRVRIPQAWLRRENVPVTVLATFDEVFLVSSDGSHRAAAAGAVLAPGERLTTSAEGSATLALQDGSRILVRPGSQIALDDSSRPIELPVEASETDDRGTPAASPIGVQLRLLRGAVENAVRRLDSSGRFEIETPAAVAAVRGTELRVSIEGEFVNIELPSGRALVRNERGTVRVDPRKGTRTRPGLAPEPPMPLLPAPDLSALPQVITRLPIDLPLALSDGAVGWRAQLSPEPFVTIESDRFTPGPRLRAREPANGVYRLTVRAVDAHGLEGLSAGRDLRVHVRPVPPLLIAPAPDARIVPSAPLFRWSQAASSSAGGDARSVRLQVAPSADFAAPAIDQTVRDDGRFEAQTELARGVWYWRLLVSDPALGPGPWSDVQEFQVVLPAPGVAAPEIDSDSLTLRWPSVPGATRYRVQIATDLEFSAPIVERTLEEDRIKFDRPQAGVYFMRVQALATDGEPGAFSAAERFQVEQPVNLWNALWLLLPLLLAF